MGNCPRHLRVLATLSEASVKCSRSCSRTRRVAAGLNHNPAACIGDSSPSLHARILWTHAAARGVGLSTANASLSVVCRAGTGPEVPQPVRRRQRAAVSSAPDGGGGMIGSEACPARRSRERCAPARRTGVLHCRRCSVTTLENPEIERRVFLTETDCRLSGHAAEPSLMDGELDQLDA